MGRYGRATVEGGRGDRGGFARPTLGAVRPSSALPPLGLFLTFCLLHPRLLVMICLVWCDIVVRIRLTFIVTTLFGCGRALSNLVYPV